MRENLLLLISILCFFSSFKMAGMDMVIKDMLHHKCMHDKCAREGRHKRPAAE